jgi:bifunctional DNA-binding transcriptional regulator/antitoxin component of YhaV-PrlF toxin-antitoxin module
MPSLKLHYDGWIALPVSIRQALGLSSGDRIDAELVDGALVLRPATKARTERTARTVGPPKPSDAAPDVLRLIDEPVASATASRPARKVKRNDSAELPRRRGRPEAKTTVAASAADHPLVGIGPAKLIKKTEIEKKAASPELPPAPVARIRPDRPSQAVERRPFRNVEVRALGPGRGHNRSRRVPSGSAG